jgi:hypothetical protein
MGQFCWAESLKLCIVTFCVQVPPLLFFRWSRWRLSVGSLGFFGLDSILKPIAGVKLPKEVFTSRARWMPLIVEWNASANIFYLLMNLLLLILVIFKPKCINLISNEIMVLNASYVCLHAFSLHRESPDPDPGRWTPHLWGGSATIWVFAALPQGPLSYLQCALVVEADIVWLCQLRMSTHK